MVSSLLFLFEVGGQRISIESSHAVIMTSNNPQQDVHDGQTERRVVWFKFVSKFLAVRRCLDQYWIELNDKSLEKEAFLCSSVTASAGSAVSPFVASAEIELPAVTSDESVICSIASAVTGTRAAATAGAVKASSHPNDATAGVDGKIISSTLNCIQENTFSVEPGVSIAVKIENTDCSSNYEIEKQLSLRASELLLLGSSVKYSFDRILRNVLRDMRSLGNVPSEAPIVTVANPEGKSEGDKYSDYISSAFKEHSDDAFEEYSDDMRANIPRKSNVSPVQTPFHMFTDIQAPPNIRFPSDSAENEGWGWFDNIISEHRAHQVNQANLSSIGNGSDSHVDSLPISPQLSQRGFSDGCSLIRMPLKSRKSLLRKLREKRRMAKININSSESHSPPPFFVSDSHSHTSSHPPSHALSHSSLHSSHSSASGSLTLISTLEVNDVVRASVVCATISQVKELLHVLRTNHRNGTVQVVNVKNRFKNPVPNGYRDFLVSIGVPIPATSTPSPRPPVPSSSSSSSSSSSTDYHRPDFAPGDVNVDDNYRINEHNHNINHTEQVYTQKNVICELQIHLIDILLYSRKVNLFGINKSPLGSSCTYLMYVHYRKYFMTTKYDKKRSKIRFKVMEKMNQIMDTPTILDDFMGLFFEGDGRVTKEVDRLAAHFEFFQFVGTYTYF